MKLQQAAILIKMGKENYGLVISRPMAEAILILLASKFLTLLLLTIRRGVLLYQIIPLSYERWCNRIRLIAGQVIGGLVFGQLGGAVL